MSNKSAERAARRAIVQEDIKLLKSIDASTNSKSAKAKNANKPRRRNSNNRRNAPVVSPTTFVSPPNLVRSAATSARAVALSGRQPNPSRGVGGTIGERYLKCLVSPESIQANIPDSSVVKRALLYSRQEYPVAADTSTGGRFSVCVQPKLGTTSANPTQYKLALTKPTLGNWDTESINWADPATYVQTLDNDWVSADQYAQLMTASPVFNTVIFGGGTFSAVNCLGTNPAIQATSSTPTVGSLSTVTPGSVNMPAGSFEMSIRSTGVTISEPPNITTIPSSGPVVTQIDFVTSADGSLAYRNFIVTSLTPFVADFGATAASITDTTLTISPSWTGSQTQAFIDGGAITKLRPVAQSVLYSSALPELTDGGFVGVSRLPGGVANQNFFTQASGDSAGQMQFMEKVCRTPIGKRYPHHNGCYVWWAPEGPNDIEWKTPSDSLGQSYPSMIISGQCTGDPNPGIKTVGALIVTTVWEFTTANTMWEQHYVAGSAMIMDTARHAFMGLPAVMENPQHESWIRRVYDQVAPVFKAAAPYLVPLLKAGVGLL